MQFSLYSTALALGYLVTEHSVRVECLTLLVPDICLSSAGLHFQLPRIVRVPANHIDGVSLWKKFCTSAVPNRSPIQKLYVINLFHSSFISKLGYYRVAAFQAHQHQKIGICTHMAVVDKSIGNSISSHIRNLDDVN